MDTKYYDLDVPRSSATPQLIARLLDCEYLYIAITTTVSIDEFNFKDKKKSAKEERQRMRESLIHQLTPLTGPELTAFLEKSEDFRSSSASRLPSLSPPRLFNRLTLTCSDTDLAGLFFKEFANNIRKFDVIAFEPLSSAAFTYAIESPLTIPIDLISIKPTQSSSVNDFRPAPKQCAQLLRRGVYFDIRLSPLLFRSGTPTSARTSLATLLTHLDSVCRFQFSRLLVLTSGAQSGWEVRRPQAIASIICAICPSLASGNAPLAMQQTNPWQAISRGLSRRDSKVAHGAATLLRLLADHSVVEVVKVEPESDEKKTGNEKTVSEHTDLSDDDEITSPESKKRKLEAA
nr:ribonuclease P:MRP protein subunit RPP1 [Hymenolepis microstoma]CUU97472.1 ribonuclease P:MRP protein subunit RPP1 [Hymenolepis microstoma]